MSSFKHEESTQIYKGGAIIKCQQIVMVMLVLGVLTLTKIKCYSLMVWAGKTRRRVVGAALDRVGTGERGTVPSVIRWYVGSYLLLVSKIIFNI